MCPTTSPRCAIHANSASSNSSPDCTGILLAYTPTSAGGLRKAKSPANPDEGDVIGWAAVTRRTSRPGRYGAGSPPAQRRSA